MKKLCLAVLLLTIGTQAHALDADRLADHLRKALSLDMRTDIRVSSSVIPAGIGDLSMVTVNVGGGNYPVYLSKDESRYIWGQMMDLRVDPDEDHTRKISLDKAHSMGFKNAPVTIVEFSDLECSFCRKAHETLKQELYKKYSKSQVRLVFKHYPLSMHPWSETAAVATECAATQREDAFWEMADSIFRDSPTISTANVTSQIMLYAKQSKLDTAALNACMSSPGTALARVASDKKEGMAVGVSSTPTLFINGRMRRGFRDFDDVAVVVDEKLKDKKK